MLRTLLFRSTSSGLVASAQQVLPNCYQRSIAISSCKHGRSADTMWLSGCLDATSSQRSHTGCHSALVCRLAVAANGTGLTLSDHKVSIADVHFATATGKKLAL